MVWPILISVDVTPRMSAAAATTGEVRTATVLRTANPVTKRIDTPSPFFIPARSMTASRARLSALSPIEHAMTPGSTPNIKNAASPPRF
jgi:hypothetical protein